MVSLRQVQSQVLDQAKLAIPQEQPGAGHDLAKAGQPLRDKANIVGVAVGMGVHGHGHALAHAQGRRARPPSTPPLTPCNAFKRLATFLIALPSRITGSHPVRLAGSGTAAMASGNNSIRRTVQSVRKPMLQGMGSRRSLPKAAARRFRGCPAVALPGRHVGRCRGKAAALGNEGDHDREGQHTFISAPALVAIDVVEERGGGDPGPDAQGRFGQGQPLQRLPMKVVHDGPPAAAKTWIAAGERTYVKARCLQQYFAVPLTILAPALLDVGSRMDEIILQRTPGAAPRPPPGRTQDLARSGHRGVRHAARGAAAAFGGPASYLPPPQSAT